VDPASGDVLLTGNTFSPNFPTVNPLQAGFNGSGLFRSTNAAANWSRRNAAGLQNFALSSLLVDPQNPTTLYAISSGRVVKSTDGGDSWSASGTGLGNRTITSLVLDPLNPATLYAGIDAYSTDVGVFKSTNGGASWTPSYSSATHPGVTALAVDPVTPSTLYAGAIREEYDPKLKTYYYFTAVYKSSNGGGSWTLSSTGIPEDENRIGAVAVDPFTPATVYAATTFGVYKSTNGGGSWALSNTGLSGDVYHLAIDPANPATLYAATAGRVYCSTNGGASWALSSTGLPTAGISALVINPADSSVLYVGTSAGIYKTTNAAASWARADTGVTNPNITALALAPSSPSTLYSSGATDVLDVFVTRIGASPAAYYYVYPDSGPVQAGVPIDLYVFALDAQFQLIPDYTGLILFYATDPQAVTPVYYQFQRSDRGFAYFPGGLTFNTVGFQELYVFDWPGVQAFGYAAFDVRA
jgi:photosystem II stability/assembly factor-like uncharacterized protein